MWRTPVALIAVAFCMHGPAATEADAQGRFGSIVGRVTDVEGRPVAGARVEFSVMSCGPCLRGGNQNTDTETNRDGEYAFVNMTPAVYEITIAARSATTLLFWRRRDVTLALDAVARVDATLEPLRVQIILRTYRPDGRIEATSRSGTTARPIPNGFAWADPILCTALTSGMPRRSGPTPSVGWQVTGRVLGAADEALAVRIDWQRLWDQGQPQSKPQTGTLEAKIPLGERFSLDFVTLAPSKECPVSAARLEVAVVPPAATVANDERADALRAQRIANLARGRVTEQGTANANLRDGLAPSRDQRAAALLQLLDAKQAARGEPATPGPLFETEIWLVHKFPDGAERSELIRQPLRDSASFVFPSVRLTSAGSSTDLEVFGFVRRLLGDDGVASLQVAIGQRHAGTGASDNYSGSGKAVSWPPATEVLSFELPSDNRLPAGHRFDLRLRITPR